MRLSDEKIRMYHGDKIVFLYKIIAYRKLHKFLFVTFLVFQGNEVSKVLPNTTWMSLFQIQRRTVLQCSLQVENSTKMMAIKLNLSYNFNF